MVVVAIVVDRRYPTCSTLLKMEGRKTVVATNSMEPPTKKIKSKDLKPTHDVAEKEAAKLAAKVEVDKCDKGSMFYLD